MQDCPAVASHLVICSMSRRMQWMMLLSAPMALLAALPVFYPRLVISARDLDYVVRFDLPAVDAPVDLPRVDGPADASRPLVVIDAGHGGFDPGAGAENGGVREKTVALQIAQAIRRKLLVGGGVRVALTRDADRFIALGDRPDIARRLNADLFLSIHADSAEGDTARGASVYVLSERGSSEAAERFAARENQAGKVNGVVLAKTSEDVGAILLDLSQRGSQAGSSQFANLLLREMRDAGVGLHRDQIETAALAVLKAPDIPSVLFETGYINNADDARFLTSKQGQDQLAQVAANAVRAWFARRVGA